MKVTGSREIAEDPDLVWQRLNDPEILKQSIAGCESMRVESEGEFVAHLKLKFGPVSAAFDGRLSLSNIVDNRSYTITFEGLGGIAGHGRGVADITLAPTERGTLLTYFVEAETGGKVARIGSRLVQGIARRMINDFFTRFDEAVTGSSPD
jgi:carbon monoxide dehydrogenase subunit G